MQRKYISQSVSDLDLNEVVAGCKREKLPLREVFIG
jgi:hypothetical protein